MDYNQNQVYVGNLRNIRGDPQNIREIIVEEYRGIPTGYQTFQKGYIPNSEDLQPGINLVLNSINTPLVNDMLRSGLSFKSIDGIVLPEKTPINLIELGGPLMKPGFVCIK
jgi:hypothetical protein